MAGIQLAGGGVSAPQVQAMIAGQTTSSRLYTQLVVQAGDTVSATTTSEQPYASNYTLPANTLAVGQELRVRGAGIYTTSALLAPTQRARLRFGGQTMVDSGALTQILGLTACRYIYDISLIVRAIGASGAVEAFGELKFATSLNVTVIALGGPSGTVGDAGNPVTVNTTVDMPMQLSCAFGAVQVGNTNTMRQLAISTLKPATM